MSVLQVIRSCNGKFVLFVAMALLLVFSSCSKKDIEVRDELSTPEKTYRLWLETAERGDIQSNNKCITEASKRLVDGQMGQMAEFMKRMAANVSIFKVYTIAEQKVKDDKAVVILKGPKDDLIAVPLKKEEDGWKIDLISLFGGG